MKKMFKLLFILVGVIIFVLMLKNVSYSKKEKKSKTFGYNSKPSGLFLENIDFSEGDFSLYIKHKEYGEFMVINEKALKKNINKLIVKSSYLNLLPGEADRSFGVILFKNKKRIKSELGAVFKSFEIGTLLDYSLPVIKKNSEGTKKELKKKLDSLKTNSNAFITYQPKFLSDNRSFSFKIDFPSMAIPVKRDCSAYKRIDTINGVDIKKWQMESEINFDNKWSDIIEKYIREKAFPITNFDVSVSKGSLSATYLLDMTENENYLKTPNKKTISINDFIFYDFSAYIKANKENAEKLLALDYFDCLTNKDLNRQLVISKMKELVKQSTKPNLNVDKGEVGLEIYKDIIRKSTTIYEQRYQLNWVEIK